ncbi:MAG: MerR family transcriptional regulator [Candidatus Omnitrophica bacterium]|nr:MerR family transcriptional regulator [Candidatus Omnitrophota bacterium]
MTGKVKKIKDVPEVEIGANEPVFTTGVVCRLLDVPVWVLKQLDSEGIVSPRRENENQPRLYSKKELSLVKHCWYYLSEHRVKIHGLKVILRMEQGDLEI